MNDHSDGRNIYAVEVQLRAPGCAWSVTRGDDRVMSGEAPSPASADRCGAFAAAALEALERAGRRRF